ncbi:MAG: transcription termination factor NusA [Oscillospiraceae bacterium]|nr:transcription termination factor NusA [Oscillospiraceae bacterium]
MNTELIAAIQQLEKERGIDAEVLYQAIEEALISSYKREFDAKTTDNIRAEVNRETGDMKVYMMREVVEEVEDPNSQISLAEAQGISDDFEIGDLLEFELSPQDFGRLAAQTAKNVIVQKLATAERDRIQDEFSTKIGELVTGVVQRRDRNEVIVDIDRAEAVLTRHEQVKTESYHFNQRMKFYVLKVDDRRGRPVVFISRSHPNMVRKLFEQEVPEIKDGVVEIISVAREAGARTKIAVASRDADVDALGACVGQHGLRVQAVMTELNNEKIDIIEWDPVLENFISNALSPAKVVRVDADEENRSARVIVPDAQLSLAIGKEGQNARLAAKLTGWKIDIKSESQYRELFESEFMQVFEAAAEETAPDRQPAEPAEEDQAAVAAEDTAAAAASEPAASEAPETPKAPEAPEAPADADQA